MRRVVEKPWQVVAGDIIGPLPRTSKGFEYIGTSRLVHQVGRSLTDTQGEGQDSGRGTQSEDIPPVRLPGSFVSDDEAAFTNHVVVDFLRERGVHRTLTPPYDIQATQVECAHRTLKAMVAPYLKKRHTTWDEKFQELLFDMNTSLQTTTSDELCLVALRQITRATWHTA